MNYKELLKHPKWQKKRLEIMERDNWKCIGCHAEDKTLHVHHEIYFKGKKPWEYDEKHLKTYCLDCHKDYHDVMDLYKSQSFGDKKNFYLKLFKDSDKKPIFYKSFMVVENENTSIILHVPSSFWKTYNAPVDQIIQKMKQHPEALDELRDILIYG